MHCKRPPFTPCQVGDGPIERLAHRVWRVRGDTDPNMRRGQGAESRESLLERLERSAGAARVGDTCDAGGPRVAHAPLRRAGKLLRGRRVLERAQRADPAGELALRILAGEVGQLEVGVGVDESGNEAGFRESELPHSRGRGNEWLRSYGGDDAAVVNENGAVLDGRRRDGVHEACTDA